MELRRAFLTRLQSLLLVDLGLLRASVCRLCGRRGPAPLSTTDVFPRWCLGIVGVFWHAQRVARYMPIRDDLMRAGIVLDLNGGEARQFVCERQPKIVLTDVMMPRLRGDELCQLMKPQSERRTSRSFVTSLPGSNLDSCGADAWVALTSQKRYRRETLRAPGRHAAHVVDRDPAGLRSAG